MHWGIDQMPARTVHILIEGRVQGVGFRYWVAQQATALGLGGWVCNRRTGAVEAILQGDAAAVDAMVGACRRGPSGSRVDALHTIEDTKEDVSDGRLGTFVSFEVRDTL